MKVLVINAGSSSLKYQLIDMADETVLAKGNAERIGIDNSVLSHTPAGKEKVEIRTDIKDHVQAVRMVIDALVHPEYGVIKDMSEISAVGHRVVHGGEKFSGSVVIDDDVMEAIRANSELAPLHNPANITGIEACKSVMPNTPMVAVFDTAFHQTMPRESYIYAIPYSAYEKYGIRRYGFHGTSHKYVSLKAAKLMGRPIEELKIVTCHLGNGSSITAVKNGKSVDTSMGFTPLEGLPMGTRCGTIDPAIIMFLMEKENMTYQQINHYLNKESGVLGISGVSSDFRDLEAAAREGNERAKLALDIFAYSIKKYIGAYAAAMGGLDCVVFTAGIGENNPYIRQKACEGLEFLGIKIDEEKNQRMVGRMGREGEISTTDSKVKVLVVPTNEELMIARETVELVG
ncbi:MAG: acetate kinase [Caldicoprobacter oshimai]|uniref:Acetate kinase n=1 Tax=Caldicoprobacter faecalis TaxID=937334 RepID=A0A1I5WE45_9FIRM|nr:acetate kinase [Caldicoprobacter faecalis]PZN11605.1 MAG: acetate kinase [Caldicoprobacter oshimai]SFQ17616.1 acetate kinase [Caldicoprobacter faecalis]